MAGKLSGQASQTLSKDMRGVHVIVSSGEKKNQSPQSHSSTHSHESDDNNETSRHSESSEDAASSSDSNEQRPAETAPLCRVDIDRLYSDQSQDGQALSRRTNIIRDIVKVIIIIRCFFCNSLYM